MTFFPRILTYAKSPGMKKLFFLPKLATGYTPLSFNIPFGDSLVPSPELRGKKQHLYVDKYLQLYMAEYNEVIPFGYRPVQLHIGSNMVYTSVQEYHHGVMCPTPGKNGVKLSRHCTHKYKLQLKIN